MNIQSLVLLLFLLVVAGYAAWQRFGGRGGRNGNCGGNCGGCCGGC
ncbi:MAG: hypothetical protein NC113_08005 [Bacteroides sp.]|nr:hypothetical protein [Bacteroides sp.]MCM1448143.1 hypothetical protein [Bacteroides sp.]MCM1515373.1 hypothetical protein [Paraprevotella sp.]